MRPTVGYLPFADTTHSVEAAWLEEHLPVAVRVAYSGPALNGAVSGVVGSRERERLGRVVDDFRTLPAVVAEGPGGFLLAALLRSRGFAGAVTILPYVNPRRWYDVAAVALYRRFADPRDRVFLGSGPSAAIYRALGVGVSVAEPYGIDDRVFMPGPSAGAARVRDELSIPSGRMLLYSGRAQPDKDLYRLLRVGVKARVLFPDLQVVVASHVVDGAYLAAARAHLDGGDGVHFREGVSRPALAGLYSAADVVVTASTSHFETFGRALAEALACGTPVVAPRYDGFAEVLAQVGGTLVDVDTDPRTGLPCVDEQPLLRAVYEVLSAPHPPPAGEVAAAARRRFGRSETIRVLDHLAGGSPAGPVDGVAPAGLELPGEWRAALVEVTEGERPEAVPWFWRHCDDGSLASHDEAFVGHVRRLLCRPPVVREEVAAACR